VGTNAKKHLLLSSAPVNIYTIEAHLTSNQTFFYILPWCRAFPCDQGFKLVVHVPPSVPTLSRVQQRSFSFCHSSSLCEYCCLKMLVGSIVSPWAFLLLPVLYVLLPYLRNWSLMKVPGPITAALTNLWLMYQCRRGRRYLAVNELHQKYGKVVRIQPNHVSIADDAAINIIYGHGNGFLKR
jgi:hypothetical protein